MTTHQTAHQYLVQLTASKTVDGWSRSIQIPSFLLDSGYNACTLEGAERCAVAVVDPMGELEVHGAIRDEVTYQVHTF